MFNSDQANKLWQSGNTEEAARQYVRDYFASFNETVAIHGTEKDAEGIESAWGVAIEHNGHPGVFVVWYEQEISAVYGEY